MEFFAHMTFLFWASLFFLIGFALCIHFDVCGLKTKLNNWFLSIFNAVLPDEKENINQELKSNMAKAATFIFYVAVFILLISILLAFALPYSLSEEDNKYTGPLGDLFNGLLTPFLTFLTFCGLLITIMIQNVQMKATLKELRLTQKETRKSRSALEAQVNNAAFQKFDNSFFSLLDNHKKVVDELIRGRTFASNGSYSGQVEVSAIKLFSNFSRTHHISVWESQKDQMLSVFLINYNLLSYIDRHIYNADKLSGVFEFKDAKIYSNLLRAIIPNEILYLIFFNITAGDFSDYKKLLEKYSFFEHLDFSDVDPIVFSKLIVNIDISVFGDKKRLERYIKEKRSNKEFFNTYLNNLAVYLNFSKSYSKEEMGVILDKAKEFVFINYHFDFIQNNISSFFKALLSNDINELLKLKKFELSDLLKYEKIY